MPKTLFNRTIQELEANAIYWWPDFLSQIEGNVSIIPLLIKTQDKFLSLLNLSDKNPYKISELIKSSDFPANLFLKHLVVLTDFGGEQIQRLNKQFSSVFEKKRGKFFFTFTWKEQNYDYFFKKLPIVGNLDNKKLCIDGKSITKEQTLDDLKEDLISILLFGANSINDTTASNLAKCEIGNLLGRKEELEKYVKEKYIWVSRITGGAQANTLGQVAQTYIVDYLKSKLDKSFSVKRNGSVKVVGSKKNIPFDIVVKKGNKTVGIEVTFQVTTNSTIERKSGQAKARRDFMHKVGNFVVYIIDGAGNFQRRSAISTICNYSDCTVTYSQKEFDILVKFIKEKL
ncbi:MAG: restriction endonuclease [Candidatus Vogelbacteria bacterium CG10_big_fil_rev_8_21_14_0_10_45_14]|uniref:Restriction endonuclease n=1 Tax=Candidatus Vogelbacteria bacterium CG10_big_fil_rev_8_21_14_0_10_45_14 TaxID=1975042 RepID=A0A2H0RIY3_9BACT|nr:MAG: restriction endonuclease [Candidatus Vogelbacteria bacterium CG10_big_fil_rev_8_21_14_0_10_45_14]